MEVLRYLATNYSRFNRYSPLGSTGACILSARREHGQKGCPQDVNGCEKIVGIITERDYARKIVLMARLSKDTPVRDIMTASAMYVSPVQRSEECMALMTENRVRHLLVIDNGKLLGLVSIGDLVRDTISGQQFVIGQLEHYITGEPG